MLSVTSISSTNKESYQNQLVAGYDVLLANFATLNPCRQCIQSIALYLAVGKEEVLVEWISYFYSLILKSGGHYDQQVRPRVLRVNTSKFQETYMKQYESKEILPINNLESTKILALSELASAQTFINVIYSFGFEMEESKRKEEFVIKHADIEFFMNHRHVRMANTAQNMLLQAMIQGLEEISRLQEHSINEFAGRINAKTRKRDIDYFYDSQEGNENHDEDHQQEKVDSDKEKETIQKKLKTTNEEEEEKETKTEAKETIESKVTKKTTRLFNNDDTLDGWSCKFCNYFSILGSRQYGDDMEVCVNCSRPRCIHWKCSRCECTNINVYKCQFCNNLTNDDIFQFLQKYGMIPPDKTEDTKEKKESEIKGAESWACGSCSFINQPTFKNCEICARPKSFVYENETPKSTFSFATPSPFSSLSSSSSSSSSSSTLTFKRYLELLRVSECSLDEVPKYCYLNSTFSDSHVFKLAHWNAYFKVVSSHYRYLQKTGKNNCILLPTEIAVVLYIICLPFELIEDQPTTCFEPDELNVINWLRHCMGMTLLPWSSVTVPDATSFEYGEEENKINELHKYVWKRKIGIQ